MKKIPVLFVCLLFLSLCKASFAAESSLEKWQALSDAALALRDGGDCNAAIKKWEESVEVVKESQLHDSLLSQSLGNIGYCYSTVGDYQQAIAFLSQSATLDSAVYGAKSKVYASALSPLGEAYVHLGDFAAAHTILATSTRIFSKGYGEYGYWYVTALTAYGIVLKQEGHTRKAKKQFEKSIAICDEAQIVYGPKAYCYIELGDMYSLRSKWDKAEESFRSAITTLLETEPESPMLAQARNRLLNLYEQTSQSEKYHTLRESIDQSGESDKATGVIPNETALRLCAGFLQSGDIHRADSVTTACLLEIEKRAGRKNEDYIVALEYFSDLYYMTGHSEQRNNLLELTIETIESLYGKSSPRALDALIDLGYERAVTSPDEGLQLLRKAENILSKSKTRKYKRLNELESALGEVYFNLGKPQDSYTHYERALQAARESFGRESIEAAEALITMAVSDFQSGFTARLEKHTKQALKIYRKHPETPSAGYPIALKWLSSSYEEQERWRDAIELLLESTRVESTWQFVPSLPYSMEYNSLSNYYLKLGINDSALLMHDLYVERVAIEDGESSSEYVLALDLQKYRLLALGDTAKALEVAQRRVTTSETHRASDDPERAEALVDLSVVWYLSGNVDSALIIADSALRLSEKISGEDADGTKLALQNLIQMQRAAGQYRQAEINAAVFLAPSATSDSVQFDSMTVISMREVALSVYRQGDYQEAERLLVELLDAQEQFYGKSSPEVFRTLNVLSATYSYLYKFKEMTIVCERAISIAPMDMIGVHGYLARIYEALLYPARARGAYDETQRLIDMMRNEALLDNIAGEALYLRAEEYQLSLFVESRKFTEADSAVSVMIDYATTHGLDTSLYYLSLIRRGADVLLEVEEYDSALVIYHIVYPKLELKNAVDTSFVASILPRMGEALAYSGDYDSAVSVFSRVSEILHADLPTAIVANLSDIGTYPPFMFEGIEKGEVETISYRLKSESSGRQKTDTVVYKIEIPKFSDSIAKGVYLDSLRDLAELRADIAAVDFPRRAQLLQSYFLSCGKVFEFRGEWDSAEAYYDQASYLLHNTAVFKAITLSAIEAQVRLGDLYSGWGKVDLAEIAYHVALDTIDVTKGEWAHYASLAHASLGRIHELQGDNAAAEKEYRAMVTSSEATNKAVSLDVAESMTVLAAFLKRQNKLREAAEILERAEKMITDVYGANDLRRLIPLLELYEVYNLRKDIGLRKRIAKEITSVVESQEKRQTLMKRSKVKQILADLERLGLKNEVKTLSDARAYRY